MVSTRRRPSRNASGRCPNGQVKTGRDKGLCSKNKRKSTGRRSSGTRSSSGRRRPSRNGRGQCPNGQVKGGKDKGKCKYTKSKKAKKVDPAAAAGRAYTAAVRAGYNAETAAAMAAAAYTAADNGTATGYGGGYRGTQMYYKGTSCKNPPPCLPGVESRTLANGQQCCNAAQTKVAAAEAMTAYEAYKARRSGSGIPYKTAQQQADDARMAQPGATPYSALKPDGTPYVPATTP